MVNNDQDNIDYVVMDEVRFLFGDYTEEEVMKEYEFTKMIAVNQRKIDSSKKE